MPPPVDKTIEFFSTISANIVLSLFLKPSSPSRSKIQSIDAPVLVSISSSVSKKFINNSSDIILPTVDFPEPIGPTIKMFIVKIFEDFNT